MKKISPIEEKAWKNMKSIFETIASEEMIDFKGYFASDMIKVDGKSCVYPCFIGFTSTSIVLARVNGQLEKEEIIHLSATNLKEVKIKKSFLSKFIKVKIYCNDNRSFVAGVPQKLKYIEVQEKNVEQFREFFSKD